jgi:hypothetical protein
MSSFEKFGLVYKELQQMKQKTGNICNVMHNIRGNRHLRTGVRASSGQPCSVGTEVSTDRPMCPSQIPRRG